MKYTATLIYKHWIEYKTICGAIIVRSQIGIGIKHRGRSLTLILYASPESCMVVTNNLHKLDDNKAFRQFELRSKAMIKYMKWNSQ